MYAALADSRQSDYSPLASFGHPCLGRHHSQPVVATHGGESL